MSLRFPLKMFAGKEQATDIRGLGRHRDWALSLFG